MSKTKELELQMERLGGQMVGVQAAVDAIVLATLQTGADVVSRSRGVEVPDTEEQREFIISIVEELEN